MAKKKKIVISDEELKPTVLYTVKERKVNFLAMILLFGIFIGVIYILPEAYERYDLYKKGLIDSPFIEKIPDDIKNKDKDTDKDKDVVSDKYEFSEELEIKNNQITLNNFSFANNVLTFAITNNSTSSVNLTNSKYYLSIYNANNNMLKRIKVAEDTFNAKETKNYSYTINSANIFSVIFKEIKESEYPIVSLTANENGEADLTCKLDNETITYSFIDNKLQKIKDEIIVMNTVANYNDELMKYQNLVQTYNGYEAGIAIVLPTDTQFTYNLSITPSDTLIAKIANKNFYKTDTEAKVINYELEARGYTCN